jgi:hypothetical protein
MSEQTVPLNGAKGVQAEGASSMGKASLQPVPLHSHSLPSQ